MKKIIKAIACVVLIAVVTSTNAFADNPAQVSVTVQIAAAADISVSGTTVDFGPMAVNDSKVTPAASPIVVDNSGSGSNQTYSLNLTNPNDWTAVITEPAVDEYRLSAVFDADGQGITWDPANHALTTTAVPSSATKFAGDETGTGVAYDVDRHLHLKMETPERTDKLDQTITVTITATVD